MFQSKRPIFWHKNTEMRCWGHLQHLCSSLQMKNMVFWSAGVKNKNICPLTPTILHFVYSNMFPLKKSQKTAPFPLFFRNTHVKTERFRSIFSLFFLYFAWNSKFPKNWHTQIQDFADKFAVPNQFYRFFGINCLTWTIFVQIIAIARPHNTDRITKQSAMYSLLVSVPQNTLKKCFRIHQKNLRRAPPKDSALSAI